MGGFGELLCGCCIGVHCDLVLGFGQCLCGGFWCFVVVFADFRFGVFDCLILLRVGLVYYTVVRVFSFCGRVTLVDFEDGFRVGF